MKPWVIAVCVIGIIVAVVLGVWYIHGGQMEFSNGPPEDSVYQLAAIGQQMEFPPPSNTLTIPADYFTLDDEPKTPHPTRSTMSLTEGESELFHYVIGKYSLVDPNTQLRLKEYIVQQHSSKPTLKNCLAVSRMLFREPSFQVHNLAKLFVAKYIIRYSDSNKEIASIYDWLIATLKRTATIDTEFANDAVDMLIMSNHSGYKAVAKQYLQVLRNHEDAKTQSAPEARILEQRETQVRSKLTRLDAARDPDFGLTREEMVVQRALLEQLTNIRKSKKAMGILHGAARAPRTIYQDSQNAHNHEITESVRQSAKKLCAIPSSAFIGIDDSWADPREWDQVSSADKSKISKSLQRIASDSTVLEGNITLSGTFRGLVRHISEQTNPDIKRELSKRLIQELIDMSGHCFTGHLDKLTIVPHGVTLDTVKMDIGDEVYASLSARLNKALQMPENDAVLSALDDGNIKPYQDFVRTFTKQQLPVIHGEYEKTHAIPNVNLAVVNAINKYAKGLNIENIEQL
jgi:hypothetical protein